MTIEEESEPQESQYSGLDEEPDTSDSEGDEDADEVEKDGDELLPREEVITHVCSCEQISLVRVPHLQDI